MTQRLSEIQQQLMGTFFEEAFEALTQVESGLLALEKSDAAGGDVSEVINDVFRAAHSIKGGAATFGLNAIAELAHAAETLLDRLRSGTLAVTPDVTAMLLESVDVLRSLANRAAAGNTESEPSAEPLRKRLEVASALPRTGQPAALARTGAAKGVEATHARFKIGFAPKPHMLTTGNDAVRLLRELALLGQLQITVDVSRLPELSGLDPTLCYLGWQIELEGTVTRAQIDEVFSWVDEEAELVIEELVEIVDKHSEAPPSAARARAEAEHAPVARAGEFAGGEGQAGSIRVSVGKLDMLMNMVGELVITQSILGELEGDGPIDVKRLASLRDGLALLARNTRALQESVMSLRSMPIGTVLARLPRLVHDLGHQLGKQVELKLSGQTTEVDKTVLEKLGDPLTHLVRNSLDHGIEKPELRRARGKPETGVLSIRAFHRGSDIVVELEDDGGGLDPNRILARARERGLVGADETPSDEAIRELIFAPGFSTAETVSDVSGRGVGMDVVRRNIKAIGGQIQLSSVFGHGTRITLRLPLTLAIIDGQLVGVSGYSYVVPLLSILESVQIDPTRVSWLEGLHPLYRLREGLVPIVSLAALLGVAIAPRTATGLLVVVEADGERLGLLVDELLAQQQVVVKSLETNYEHVQGLAGATILGDGSIALILDVTGIARLARLARTAALPVRAA
jgi:two-component system, chemotaxis family, sensor kinase CheA